MDKQYDANKVAIRKMNIADVYNKKVAHGPDQMITNSPLKSLGC
jgi:hypothetical protein